MMKGNEIKIFDFGFSEEIVSESVSTFGSPLYMSPEILFQTMHDPSLGDVWSVGIIIYELLVGCTPFEEAEDLEDLQKRVYGLKTDSSENGIINFPSHVTPALADLIRQILVWEPSNRPNLESIKNSLLGFGKE